MVLKWNFRRGWGVQAKKPSMGGVWIFSGTTQSTIVNLCRLFTALYFSVTFLLYLNAWMESVENWTPAKYRRTPSPPPCALYKSLASLAFSFRYVNYRDSGM